MRYAVLCLGFAFTPSGRVFAQDAVADWYPIHAGDKWIYEHETRDDSGEGIAHLEIKHWKTEETIIGSRTIPEGTLVVRLIRRVDPPPVSVLDQVERPAAYLIRGDCLYMLGAVDWVPLNHQLTPPFRENVFAGHIAADFCFPLAVGKTWGALRWGGWRGPTDAKDWQVAGIKMRDQTPPDKQKTFHAVSISSYPGSGMTTDIWFEKGVGIVRQRTIHHGTIGEDRIRLFHFERGSQR